MKIVYAKSKIVFLQGITAFNMLYYHYDELPLSFIEELFQEKNMFTSDIYKFDQSFRRPENYEWLSRQNWILNYYEYSEFSTPALESSIKNAYTLTQDSFEELEYVSKDPASPKQLVAEKRSLNRAYLGVYQDLLGLFYARKRGVSLSPNVSMK